MISAHTLGSISRAKPYKSRMKLKLSACFARGKRDALRGQSPYSPPYSSIEKADAWALGHAEGIREKFKVSR